MSRDSVSTYAPKWNVLLAGAQPVITKAVAAVADPTPFPVGQVVGIVTASGLLAPYDTAAVDGTEVPFGVVKEEIDRTDAGTLVNCWIAGHFNEDELTFGGATTKDTDGVRDAMRVRSMYLETAEEISTGV